LSFHIFIIPHLKNNSNHIKLPRLIFCHSSLWLERWNPGVVLLALKKAWIPALAGMIIKDYWLNNCILKIGKAGFAIAFCYIILYNIV